MLYITLNLGTAAVMINLDVYIDNTLTTIVSLSNIYIPVSSALRDLISARGQ